MVAWISATQVQGLYLRWLILRQLTLKCLEQVEKDKLTSVAFPALGAGSLGFTSIEVAKIFFEEVTMYLFTQPQSPIYDIRFVVYDQATANAFLGAVQEIKSTILSPPNTTVPSQNKDEPPNVPGLKNLIMSPSLDGSLKFDLNNSNFTIEIVRADISKEKTELITHVTNQDFGFSYELPNSIIRAGGESVVRECKALREPGIFSTQYTNAGNLFVGQIAHVIAPEKPSYSDLEQCLANFLDDILKKNVAKVSFSTLGMVSMWYSATEFAKMIFDNLHCIIAQSKKPSLRLARIVILDEQEFIEFKNAAIKAYVAYRYSASPRSQTAESPHSPNLFGSKNVAHTTAKQGNILIKIYSHNWENIDEAYKALTSMLYGNIGTKHITNAMIKKLTDSDLQKLYKLAFDFDYEITVYQRNGSLICRGHMSDFFNVDEKISEILKDVTDRG